uniref:Spermidine synthase n=1 Tax=uncultured Bacteroidota bacterium TaxID=152509 RepID=H5SGH3_9BACT|nr:hypothetical protein HGMM_F25B04C02 [uncultured Bacteroidetes bacterium]
MIEGEKVHYVGGRLYEAWEALFGMAGLEGLSWGPVLLVGMGASLVELLARTAQRPPPCVDIIEIDPEMVALQERYYTWPLPYRVYEGDAAQEIRKVEGPYAGIFIDAFVEEEVPAGLRTEAFVGAVADRLAGEGLLFWNVLRRAEAQEVGALLMRAFPVVRRWRYEAHTFWGAAKGEVFPLPF